MDTMRCYLCEQSARIETILRKNMQKITCPRCGEYRISDEIIAQADIGNIPLLSIEADRCQLSGVTREATELNSSVDILATTIDALLSRAPKQFDVSGKVRKLLQAIARKSKHAGAQVRVSESLDQFLAYAANPGEFTYLSKYACDQEWVTKQLYSRRKSLGDSEGSERDWLYQLTPAGWEELKRVQSLDSHKTFVAMWFDNSVREAYEDGIKPAITDCGFHPVRIDGEEYNGDIVDQVLAEIKESRFIISDLTGHRKGVYFEGGYAMGLGTPVIWTCRSDQAKATHFDAEHFNQIRWSAPEELREKLINRIRATIGYGPLRTEQHNPDTDGN